MIPVSAACMEALNAPNVVWNLRVVWEYGGQELDISDRLIDFSDVECSMGAYLGGYRGATASVSFANDDAFFSPLGTSFTSTMPPDVFYSSSMQLSVGILTKSGALEYVKVYRGFVRELDIKEGTATFSLVDYLGVLLSSQIGTETAILPYVGLLGRPHRLFRDLADQYSPLAATSWRADDLNYIDDVLVALDWEIVGMIPQGVTLGNLAAPLLRSGLCAAWPTESGEIRLHSAWPKDIGSSSAPTDVFPDRISSDNAWGFQVSRPLEAYATEVVVKYQGESIAWRDSSKESRLGRVTKPIDCPYISTMKHARLAARILYATTENWTYVIKWGMASPGLVVRLNDIVTIEDPETGVANDYRVVAKSWSMSGSIEFEGVLESHDETVTYGTFARYGTTTWGSSSEVLF